MTALEQALPGVENALYMARLVGQREAKGRKNEEETEEGMRDASQLAVAVIAPLLIQETSRIVDQSEVPAIFYAWHDEQTNTMRTRRMDAEHDSTGTPLPRRERRLVRALLEESLAKLDAEDETERTGIIRVPLGVQVHHYQFPDPKLGDR